MVHENQYVEMLWTIMKELSKVIGCDPAKDPLTIKSIFSLEYKDGK